MSQRSETARRGELPRVGETLEGKYVLQERLASGGMGVIIKARHRKLERSVAVKLLHPRLISDENTVERFRREIDLAKRLAHPNIVQLLDYGRTETGVLFIVMEHLEGRDLDELVSDEGPLAFDRTCEITLQVLDGLAEAHERDLIHRDLKPSNIFLTDRRRGGEHAKLLDFGVAKSLSAGDSDLTQTGSACGTAMYMPPETMFERSPTKRIDVYAAGLIALEALIGRRLFDGESLPQILMKHVQQPVRMPESLVGTPAGDVLERATAKHPEERYADGGQMLEALAEASDAMPDDFQVDPNQLVEVGETIDRIDFGSQTGFDQSDVDGLHDSRPEESTDRLPATAPQETPSPAEQRGAPQRTPPEPTADGASDFESGPTEIAPTPPPASPDDDSERREIDETTAIPTWMWVAGVFSGALLLSGVAAGLYTLASGDGASSSSSRSNTAASAQAASADASNSSANSASETPSKPVRVRVHSDPGGAIIYRNDDRKGETPKTLELVPPESGPIELVVHSPGFHNETIAIDPKNPKEKYDVELESKLDDEELDEKPNSRGESTSEEDPAAEDDPNANAGPDSDRNETARTADDDPSSGRDRGNRQRETASANGSGDPEPPGSSGASAARNDDSASSTPSESNVTSGSEAADETDDSAASDDSEASDDSDGKFENIADDYSIE